MNNTIMACLLALTAGIVFGIMAINSANVQVAVVEEHQVIPEKLVDNGITKEEISTINVVAVDAGPAESNTKFTVFRVTLEVIPKRPETYQFAEDRMQQLSNIAVAVPSIKSVDAIDIKGKPEGDDKFIDARPQEPESAD